MKLPAIQFYPGDWHKDQGVQALDLAQRGAWFELLLMMHDSDERGVLLVNGQPMPDTVIARRLGLDNQTANQILTTLLAYGVASRRDTDGALFCRRMVKDENLRQVRTAAGKKGGNPLLLNQAANQTPTTGDKQIPTPSFSSSVTASIKERETADAAPPAPNVENSGEQAESKPADSRRKATVVPTLAEVQAYAAGQHPASADAQTEAAAFHDHYESNGWRVSGKTPMVDWRASFRGWMRRRPQFQTAGPHGNGQAAPPARARTAPKSTDPTRWS
ncbi:hypothetical protein SAMN02745146_3059 [Hymenobacter daecheongensis DSM 21074]|uniref:Phage replisome organizer, putative, N-terminal region n=1 Tax=Hymenobacter daecheongensis DSM 21074 TaxID=1121955 RepID=A0A1M6J1W0_9BACT|nr:hypothetical protein [Hymenobacter daecheongensis]SHJ40639.1 hypothetical protein SAMN02745146_3059 [Hymenobacter daecheongensis DSM 21074]